MCKHLRLKLAGFIAQADIDFGPVFIRIEDEILHNTGSGAADFSSYAYLNRTGRFIIKFKVNRVSVGLQLNLLVIGKIDYIIISGGGEFEVAFSEKLFGC